MGHVLGKTVMPRGVDGHDVGSPATYELVVVGLLFRTKQEPGAEGTTPG